MTHERQKAHRGTDQRLKYSMIIFTAAITSHPLIVSRGLFDGVQIILENRGPDNLKYNILTKDIIRRR
jgi:hypothetical protein